MSPRSSVDFTVGLWLPDHSDLAHEQSPGRSERQGPVLPGQGLTREPRQPGGAERLDRLQMGPDRPGLTRCQAAAHGPRLRLSERYPLADEAERPIGMARKLIQTPHASQVRARGADQEDVGLVDLLIDDVLVKVSDENLGGRNECEP